MCDDYRIFQLQVVANVILYLNAFNFDNRNDVLEISVAIALYMALRSAFEIPKTTTLMTFIMTVNS